ncbi:MAG: pirin family protein [Chromatiaceae bacterium]|nr:MAG: pirin family protein [Chromatiaceae bacterium]
MLSIRPANSRGQTRLDWLDSRHSFAFGDYQNPDRLGLSNLRVINEDRIAPGGGFPMHGHQDMEIVTWILDGALAHRDSLGNGAEIRSGNLQHMSAGTGIRHSEFNPSASAPTHLLQIWLLPNRAGVAPRYTERQFPAASRQDRLTLLVSPDGRDGSVGSHQDGLLSAALLAPGARVETRLTNTGPGYLQVASGQVQVGATRLGPGDAACIDPGSRLTISGIEAAEILLFDLP